ncbi:hypothetical protein E2C01_001806 [Portunus trituberculatus]|uniref:Uncharacterized protein n=1 Tax=Portunus trituberculatus TaxID=210409 RepID=A0A5B7CHM1_PORTR|nr:hypothetical protein [Portunus trituberculatus]
MESAVSAAVTVRNRCILGASGGSLEVARRFRMSAEGTPLTSLRRSFWGVRARRCLLRALRRSPWREDCLWRWMVGGFMAAENPSLSVREALNMARLAWRTPEDWDEAGREDGLS